MCPQCGCLVAFADDSTVTVTDKDANQLTGKLTQQYHAVSNYFTANKLKVNDDKTHLMVLTSNKKREFVNIQVTINTPFTVVQT